MAKYRVDVYEDRDAMNDEYTVGVEFHFPDYTQASAFVEQMVVSHGLTIHKQVRLLSRW